MRGIKNTKLVLFFTFIGLLFLSWCSSKVNDDQIKQISMGMDTDKALNILGSSSKETNDFNKINELLTEAEDIYHKKFIDAATYGTGTILDMANEQVSNIQVSSALLKEGQNITVREYKISNTEKFHLISMKSNEEDIILTGFSLKNR